MMELDKAVQQFRDTTRRNTAFVQRAHRVPEHQAADKLFTAASRRLKAIQTERALIRKEAEA